MRDKHYPWNGFTTVPVVFNGRISPWVHSVSDMCTAWFFEKNPPDRYMKRLYEKLSEKFGIHI